MGLEFRMRLEGVKIYLTPEYSSYWTRYSCIKMLAGLGYLGTIFVYLEMSEREGQSQGVGKYCRSVL